MNTLPLSSDWTGRGEFKYTIYMSMTKKKKQVITTIGIIAAVLLAGFAIWLLSDSGGFRTITPAEASQLIKTTPGLLIIDVRGQDEMREGWIEGTRLMPLPQILNGQMAPPKDGPILLVCAVGGRSLGLGKLMITYGWKEVYNLQGGLSNWKMQGFPVKYK